MRIILILINSQFLDGYANIKLLDIFNILKKLIVNYEQVYIKLYEIKAEFFKYVKTKRSTVIL